MSINTTKPTSLAAIALTICTIAATLSIAALVLEAAFKVSGAVGPVGPRGDMGHEGDAGPRGPPGNWASKWASGGVYDNSYETPLITATPTWNAVNVGSEGMKVWNSNSTLDWRGQLRGISYLGSLTAVFRVGCTFVTRMPQNNSHNFEWGLFVNSTLQPGSVTSSRTRGRYTQYAAVQALVTLSNGSTVSLRVLNLDGIANPLIVKSIDMIFEVISI